MTFFFDYIFYRVFYFYKSKWPDDMPSFHAILVLSLMQSFNLISLLLVYTLIAQRNILSIGMGKYHFVVIAFLILSYNFWRYLTGNRFDDLMKIWENEDILIIKRKGRFVLVYLVVSTFFVLGAAIISGEINQGRL